MPTSNDKSLLKSLAEHGEGIIEEQNDAQDAEFERQLSLFSAGVVNGSIPRSALDTAIAFFKNPMAFTQGAGSETGSGDAQQFALTDGQSDPDRAAKEAIMRSTYPIGVKRAIARLTLDDTSDDKFIAVDGQGTPTMIASLQDTNASLSQDKDDAIKDKTEAEKQRNALKTELDDFKKKPQVPVEEVQSAAEELMNIVKKGSLKPIYGIAGKEQFMLEPVDAGALAVGIDNLRDRKKVEKDKEGDKPTTTTKQMPKANR